MKFHVTWEARDIIPGRVIGAIGRGERWMVGYVAGKHSSKDQHLSLNSMSDGMISRIGTADQIAAMLNKVGTELPAEMLDGMLVEWQFTPDERTANVPQGGDR